MSEGKSIAEIYRSKLDDLNRGIMKPFLIVGSLGCALGPSIGYILMANACYREIEAELPREYYEHRQRQVNLFVRPEIRDVDSDGFDDIILKRYNGEELVLYGDGRGGYGFGEGEER